MTKPNLKSFLKDFFLVNVIIYVVYLAITTVVGMFFGGAVLEFGEAFASGDKQNVILTVFYALLQISAFFGFYLFSLLRFERNSEEKRIFLTELGTERFDLTEFSQKYFSDKGKHFLIYFAAAYGIIALARSIGIPLPLFLIFPQSMLSNVLHLLFGSGNGLMNVVFIIVSVTVNIAIYFVYQRFICAKVCEKWAAERLRVS